ncbi:hypothetical protein SECTIM467_127 [Brevibacillus phage SecTim467]|uniref:Uncharacterized protein n=2 Tax=Jenstvirus jenst TaxID=1982225 RepID=A0A0K2CP03_9CAUD|nr:hypothetical protein AVV11_gp069 [Brevibacillus phage Jenst]ALA07251.1 hypothetical protein JENST_122 [Brevibacillus phage Jenst]ALA07453.1 hypothetical protein SECTIM467_127 [Brevibacillus phage SecTim467]
MYKRNGGIQLEAKDVKKSLDPFVYEIAKDLRVTVPVQALSYGIEEEFKKACLKEMKQEHERSIEYGWIQNPESMGR